MRRASTCLALLGLAVLGLPAVASAAPTVTLKAKAVPIPGLPATPATSSAPAPRSKPKYTINGTESTGGVPSPLIARQLLPAHGHEAAHQTGFVTCPTATLENIGPERLPEEVAGQPRRARAGVVDPIGGELVQENADAAGVLRARWRSAVLRQRGLADLGSAARRQGHVHQPPRRPTAWSSITEVAAGPIGARRPAGVDRIDQHQGRRGATRRARRRSTTARCRRSARRAASRSSPN